MDEVVDFWFSTGSTYTYLSVLRLRDVAARAGLAFRWRVFSVRAIMREMNNSPFVNKPAKMSHMWRDIQRRAEGLGLPARVPAPYPLTEFDLANRVAILGLEEGWGEDYIRASYLRWYGKGQEPGCEPNLTDSLREVGQDTARVVALAQSDRVGAAYAAATDEARSLGIFGSPSFVARGELFWGDDRMEDAIAWQRHGRLGGG